ncbi:flavin reductase family protein [Cryobacterium melibiosiphilum]|uniref:flavin reductase family protein n=1 Tax=Cryobacterium melibiosiphilum TaxID=995039 RepID=UPI0018F362DC|nr:flavin reductase family protein [Cryobacterium melibiosiphilum]
MSTSTSTTTTITVAEDGSIDPLDYRQVFGMLPTGVTAITGTSKEDKPVGFVVGTFQSLSIDPPLVAFSVDKGSSTWPTIRSLENFTANVLSTAQLPVCRALSRRGVDKFADLAHGKGPHGNPRLPGSTAWLDCNVLYEVVAGDHYIIVASIIGMEVGSGDALVFRGGKFGEFTEWDQPAPAPKPIAEETSE